VYQPRTNSGGLFCMGNINMSKKGVLIL